MNDLIKYKEKNDYSIAIQMVCDGLQSQNSRRAYEKALLDFLGWYDREGKGGITKMTVQRYRTILQDSGLSSSTINVRMSAIRKFVKEASDNGLIDQAQANGIAQVKGVSSKGIRSGNWLTLEQATELIKRPDVSRPKGLRDRAVLAIMISSGMRRSEVSNLLFEHIQKRDGRWAIVDMIGKGNKIRSIPIPNWAKSLIDEWLGFANISEGRVFTSIRKGDHVTKEGLTSQAIQDIVKEYSADFGIAAHDLRRTFAKLSRKGGADIEQIQVSLGHQKIETTQKYLGTEQNFQDAPSDHLGIVL